jgi:hypothetical protein
MPFIIIVGYYCYQLLINLNLVHIFLSRVSTYIDEIIEDYLNRTDELLIKFF